MGRRRDALEGPALELARALREHGNFDLAARVEDALPPSAGITGDGHRLLLGERLRAVADDDRIAPGLRDRAEHLAGVAADLRSAIGRVGTVWIAWSPDDDPSSSPSGSYAASWQSDADDGDLYEDGPVCESLEQALEWARARSDSIVVRPSWDESRYHWAGSGHDPRGLPPLGEPPEGPLSR